MLPNLFLAKRKGIMEKKNKEKMGAMMLMVIP